MVSNSTLEEKKIQFINMFRKMKEHPDFQSKFMDNLDRHT